MAISFKRKYDIYAIRLGFLSTAYFFHRRFSLIFSTTKQRQRVVAVVVLQVLDNSSVTLTRLEVVTCTRIVKSREDVRVGITDARLVLNWPATNKSWALWKRIKHRRRVVVPLHHDHSNLNHRKIFLLLVGPRHVQLRTPFD